MSARPRLGSMFSGVGGLDLAITEALNAETVFVADVCKFDKKGMAVGHHDPHRSSPTVSPTSRTWVTSRSSTGLSGAVSSRCSALASRALTCLWRVVEPVSATAPAPVSGRRSSAPSPNSNPDWWSSRMFPESSQPQPLATWNPARSVWETDQESICGHLMPFSQILPRSGSMRTGRLDEFDEWLMGYPAGWITDVPGVTWNEALKACGNGVVPQQGAAAVRHLIWMGGPA